MTTAIAMPNHLAPAGQSRLPPDEFEPVRRLAAGDRSAAAAARAVYEKHLQTRKLSNTPEMGFLSEAFAPVPDFLLRANYRRQVLALTPPSLPGA